MNKTLISLCVMTPLVFLSGCTVVETTAPGYTYGYLAPVSTYTIPYVGYARYGYGGYGYYGNWYHGAPGYYNTSVYVSDW